MGNDFSNNNKFSEKLKRIVASHKLNEQGEEHLCQGMKEQAKNLFEEALTKNPYNYKAWLNKIKACDQAEEALEVWINSLDYVKGESMIWKLGGVIHSHLDLNEKAVLCYETAVAVNPLDSDTYYVMGKALDSLNKSEQSLSAFEKSIAIDPDNYKAWYRKGLQLYNIEKYEDAILSFDKSIDLNPSYQKSWVWKGNALLQLGSHESALNASEKALELNPESPLAWALKSFVLSDQGLTTQAEVAFKKAKELTGNADQEIEL